MIKVKRKLRLQSKSRSGSGRSSLEHAAIPKGGIPRISKLMALAIRFERLIADGTVTDMTELASLAHVSQPKMTQIMNLKHLAPDIQEELLFLPRTITGKDLVHEKMLRPIAAEVEWKRQREMSGNL